MTSLRERHISKTLLRLMEKGNALEGFNHIVALKCQETFFKAGENVMCILLTNNQDDFSSNARVDSLEKYSRFHGNTDFSVWCNTPDVKYIDSFRDLIFEINPHHITCVYKNMFETAALNNLRQVDGYACVERERNMANMDHENTGYFQEHVDKSNSCVYSTSANTKNHVTAKGVPKMSKFNGWEICDKPHREGNGGYKKPVANEAGDSIRRQSKCPSCRTLSPSVKSFPAMLRVARNHRHGNTVRDGSAGSNSPSGPSREPSSSSIRSDTPVSLSSSSTGSISNSKVAPIKIGRRFRHFRRNSSYIDQYREEYTYQRLTEARDLSNLPYNDSYFCTCGGVTCSLSKSCIQRWFPNQSHLEKSKTLSVCEKNPCITSGIPVPKRTPVLKTRQQPPAKKQPYVAQIPKLGDAQKNKSTSGLQRDNIPKMEFFATSFTVNNYNPITTPPSPAQKSASNSASSVLMNCGRVTNSPVHMAASFQHLLNQNFKGTE